MAVPAVRPHSFNQSFTISQRRIVRLNRSSYSFIVQLSLDAHAHHGELVLLDALRDRCDPFISPRHRGATPQNEHTKILTAFAAVQSVRSSRSFAMSMNHHRRSYFSPALDLRGFLFIAPWPVTIRRDSIHGKREPRQFWRGILLICGRFYFSGFVASL